MKHLKYYKPFLFEAQELQSATQSQVEEKPKSQVVEEPQTLEETPQETQKEVSDVEVKSKKITKSPKYKKPEFEFKEFYRAFKKNPSLRELLPKEIDRKIFKIKGDGFDGEPKWIGLHLDPPSKQKSEDGSEEIQLIGTQDFLNVAESEDKRFIPFIKYCENLFNNGVMEELKLDFIIKNMDNFKSHDWHDIKKNPKYLDQLEQAFQKASKAGLDSKSLNQKQLVKRYPEAKMSVEEFSDAQSWAGYFKDSINYFNSVAKEGGELPCTQFIVHDDIYYTIGGRRRMFWHFYNNLNPKVWLIKL